ncbi:hypothetical protein GA0116948_105237 [Chitinophaga costaii]|uniref:Uncharacterized protein n=1 Tax=Chitinophaga costaii TaxID=1335309 RepID=A0A1C4DEX9_9BACT|nr:hypothetical protein GA0116948_105237 [Chitinophaga costaii]
MKKVPYPALAIVMAIAVVAIANVKNKASLFIV